MSEENQQPPAETGASEQPAPVETIVGMTASDLVVLGTTGDVIGVALDTANGEVRFYKNDGAPVVLGTTGEIIPAPVLETLTGGASEDVVEVVLPKCFSLADLNGAFFDFMGFLTSRDAIVTVSATHEPHDLMSAYQEWAAKRGYDANKVEANVEGWNVLAPDETGPLRTAHDAIEALLGCVGRLRVLDRLEPDTHAKATGALAGLKAHLGL